VLAPVCLFEQSSPSSGRSIGAIAQPLVLMLDQGGVPAREG
jgi:hypothetical protein